MPRLGGIAIFAAIVIPSAALGNQHGFWGVMLGAALMCALGAIDDIWSLHPLTKLLGQIAIAALTVHLGIAIDHVTLPVVGVFDIDWLRYPVTIIWIVAIVNIVNFIDGLDGLAAGFCGIAALTFAISRRRSAGSTLPRCRPSWPGPPSGSCATTSTPPRSSWATPAR
jgi:UDP-GlcNAc:undecaprenyl-phosphate GlcNAc-1-phosphate transferase